MIFGKIIIRTVCAVAVAALLTSCSLFSDVQTGAGRATSAPTADSSDPPLTESAPATVNVAPQPEPLFGKASYSGTEAGGDITYTSARGKKITDFSFLNGLSRNFFSDTGDRENGSWYCGKTERDPVTGRVTVLSERAPDVLAAIDKYDVIYRGDTEKKAIYLTFDCGYENGYTAKILDILRDKGVPATFFLNGHYIESAPELVRRMLDEGHIVGNHGNNHKVMARLTLEDFFYEIESMNDLMSQYVPGAPYMEYFRPSYGSCSEWDMALIHEMGLREVLYSWTYYDYDPADQKSPADALAAAKSGLHPGSVLMLHTVGKTNTEWLGEFIDYVRAEGFEIRPISEL